MKVIRLRYTDKQALKDDFQRVFPSWNGTLSDLSDTLNSRHAYIKVYRDPVTGLRTHADVYALVKDDFVIPSLIQGVVISDDVEAPDHYFMGHEPTQ